MPSSEGLRLELCQIEFFGLKKLIGLKKIWVTIFGLTFFFSKKILLGRNCFWSKILLVEKCFMVKKNLGVENFFGFTWGVGI